MKRFAILFVTALFLFSALPIAALAESGVNLSSAQNGKLVISEAGVYTLTGSVRGTVEVDPGQGDVELIFDNISIDGDTGVGINMVSGDSLKITLADGAKNSISGTPAIQTAAPMSFHGAGQLIVSSSAAPIQAEKGYSICGGTIVALGTKECATPSFAAQNVLAANMDSAFPANTYIALKTAEGARVLSFSATQKFSSMLMSTGSMEKGSYQLSADSVPITVKGNTAFQVLTGINTVKASQTAQQASDDWNNWNEQQAAAYAQSQAAVYRTENAVFIPNANQYQPASQNNDWQPQAPQNTAEQADAPQNNEQTVSADDPQPSSMTGNSNASAAPANTENGQNRQQPVFPGNGQNGQQGFPGGQPNGQPGGNSYESAESPSDIVTSTLENTAASLEADMDNAETIVMSDENSQVKITDSGTYVVTGASSDGNITVKKATTGVVLILEDLDLTSTTGATVSVNKEAEVKVIISGSVTLTNNENPEDENSEDEAVADAFDGAAFKAKAGSSVYITGSGTLTINGNAKNGIKAGDDTNLVFDGVTININAVNDGINGNYDLTLLSGSFTINAGDDAVHADHILTVGSQDGAGPKINVTGCEEGLEGTVVNIYGGDINIKANDDAINAANADGLFESEMRYAVNMMGGTVTINSGFDGIDSNGDVNLIAGSATITSANAGGDAGIDYDGSLYISDDFNLNNNSGVAGPDGMPGQNGQQMAPPSMNNQNGQQMAPPDMNGQSGQQMAPPDMNGQNGQQMAPPSMNNQNGQQMAPPDSNNQNGQPVSPDMGTAIQTANK